MSSAQSTSSDGPRLGGYVDATTAALAVIILAGGALRFATLKLESLWFDELYVVWTRRLPFREMIPEVLSSEHPPVFYIIGYFWDVLGHNEFWVRSLSAAIGTATILVVYLAGKELFSRRVGVWGAAFAAAAPLMVWYSREATSYAWIVLVSITSLYMLIRSFKRGGWQNWSAYTIITVIAVFSHLSSAILVLAEAAIVPLIYRRGDDRLKQWLITQSVIIAALAAMMTVSFLFTFDLEPVDLWSLDNVVTFGRGIARAPMIVLMGYTGYAYKDPSSVAALGPLTSFAFLAFLAALTVTLISGDVRRLVMNRKTGALALFIFFLVAGPVASLLLRGGQAAGRYYTWALPALLILLAAVINIAPRRIAALAGTLMVAGLLLMTAYQLDLRHNVNMGGVMAIIREQRQEDDVMLCFPQEYCVVAADFYLGEKIRTSGGFIAREWEGANLWLGDEGWDGYRETYRKKSFVTLEGEELSEWLQSDLAGRDRFWLFAGDGDVVFIPKATVVEEALPPGWSVAETYAFPRVVLKLYVRE